MSIAKARSKGDAVAGLDVPIRWVGVTRVSSDGQVTDGDGLGVQQDAIKRWVKSRGDRLVKTCADEGVGGRMQDLGRRVALAEAIDMVRHGKADGIVAYKLDRLGRGVLVQESILAEVVALGGQLASCNPAEQLLLEEGDRDDPTRVLFRQIMGAFSEYERNIIRARCQAGINRKKARGGFLGGRAPYGYQVINRELVEMPAEMVAIAQALTMREMGATYRAIGEFFVGAGVRLRLGSEWKAQTIKTVLEAAQQRGYPQPARLNNLAKAYLDLPLDPTGE